VDKKKLLKVRGKSLKRYIYIFFCDQSFDFYAIISCLVPSYQPVSCFFFLNFGFVYMKEMVDKIEDLRALEGHKQVP